MAVRAQEKALEFICHIHPAVPRWIHGDPVRLRQILVNLSGNAIKFTEKGEVSIRVMPVGDPERLERLRIEVTDTGIGIPKSKQDAVFEVFTQVDSSTTRQFGGTGLGLSISRKLVEKMGGQLCVESKPRKGSRFWFDLPVQVTGSAGGYVLYTSDLLRDQCVMIVDDCPSVREALAVMVSACGGWVQEFDTGQAALDALLDGNVPRTGLLIMDSDMPGEGDERLSALVPTQVHNPPPMIMLLPIRERNREPALLEKGFAGCLTKPVKCTAWRACLQRVFGSQPVQADTAVPAAVREVQSAEGAMRILLVEDNAVNQRVALSMLEKFGHQVDTVDDGVAALKQLEAQCYDLVFMDCQMPVMDGYEATRRIRSREKMTGRHVPVIAMTAHAMRGDRERCLECGMDDYIAKPVSPVHIRNALQKWRRQDAGAKSERLEQKPESKIRKTFNIAGLRQRMMEDEDLCRHVMECFMEDIGSQLQQLEEVLENQAHSSIKALAHTLKGAAGNVSAERLVDLALQMEMAAEKNDGQHILEIWEDLRNETEQVCAAMGKYLHSASNPVSG
jgi:CheY-like chemotaxis protein/HPt (histidine-containing phosphotransfer) domain-containing protein